MGTLIIKIGSKIIYNQIDLEASQLFKFSRRRNNLACRVLKYWNRLPLAIAPVSDQLAFKRQLDNYIYP